MELVIGGVAAVGAGTFSNPLEVIKIRMQLQGELQARGLYVVHYRNAFHAAFTIAKNDGLLALQKGLVPALWYQFIMNGTRLGTYQLAENHGLIRRKNGDGVNPLASLLMGAFSGAVGAVVGSPLYLVKTHLQSRANEKSIAVGHQHEYKGLRQAFKSIYQKYGILGLWRGSTSAVPRVAVASAVQMLTFEKSVEFVKAQDVFPQGTWITAFCASLISGVFVTISMAPFDLVATRFYNQGVDPKGRGILYKTVIDCAKKIFKEEGFRGFYKGWTANYFRLGPHTLLLLVFWDRLKHYHRLHEAKKNSAII